MINFLKKRWYLLALVLLIAGIFVYRQKQTAVSKILENSYTLTREKVSESLSFSGKVDAYDKASLTFPVSGKLSWVGVKEGDRVEKWQILAKLDSYEAQRNLEKVLRDYSKQREDFEQSRQVTYKDQTTFSAVNDTVKRILEKNQWDLEKAVLDVELKDYALKLTTLSTPIAGIVTHIDDSVAGVTAVAAQSRIDVINPETIYFSAAADQTEVIKLFAGQKGNLVFDSYSEENIEAAIDSISYTPKEDETGTVYEIKLSFPKGDDLLRFRLGMTGDVEFITKEKDNILAVPTNATTQEEGKFYVHKISNGRKIKTEITTGEILDSKTEVLSGLSEGDTISL